MAITFLDGWLLTQTDERPLTLVLTAAIVVGAALAVIAATGRRAIALGVTATVVSLATGAWIGANSPTESWFGAMVSHGSRRDRTVALTFDDGPNVTATLAIARILDAHHVKGAFFEVGKAVARRPDISRDLLADGQLLANHSYHHDSFRWLDPRYPELGRAQRVFADDVGACPAFYRPPHGQHTPFLAFVVHRRDMTMMGWDVSVGDWALSDANLLARRVLQHVRPGSIIDLHDGLDGDLTTNRTVLVRAMPMILDGLSRKGLRVVRLDALVGRRAYLTRCPSPRRASTRHAAAGITAASMAASVSLVRDR